MGNILDLLNQLKSFINQEKGSRFSLIIYLLLGIALVDRYLPHINDNIAWFNINPLLAMLVVCIILTIFWRTTRRIVKAKDKVNVGISQMDILNISTSDKLDAEQKLQISSEVTNYIYNRLSHMKQSLKLDKHLNFLRVPLRIKIDYANSEKETKKLGLDLEIWGTIRYDDNKLYINTKISPYKNITSFFFKKLIDDLNAYPELDFDFSSPVNLEFDKFIHEITYISLIYRSLELINNFEYADAEQVLLHGIHKLNKLYDNKDDQSVNRWDKEVSKIEMLMYFILSKNYLNWSNSLLVNFDYKNKANDKLEKCSDAIDNQIEIIKKYIKDEAFQEESEKREVENAYLNAMSKLSKTKNKSVIKKQLDSMSETIKDENKHDMVRALIESRFQNLKDAKKHYEKILKDNPKNRVVLRWLGLIEYDLGNLKKAENYFLKLYNISPFYIFNHQLYDLKVQRRLRQISLKKGKIFKAIKYLRNEIVFRKYNKDITEKTYILQSF